MKHIFMIFFKTVGPLLITASAFATADLDKKIIQFFPLDDEYDAVCLGTNFDPNERYHKPDKTYPCKVEIRLHSTTMDVTYGNKKIVVPTLKVVSGLYGEGAQMTSTGFFTAARGSRVDIYTAFGGDNIEYRTGVPVPSKVASSSGEFRVDSVGYGKDNVQRLQINVDDIGSAVNIRSGMSHNVLSLSRGSDGYIYFTVRSEIINQIAVGRILVKR